MKTLAEMVQDRIDRAYGGSQAAFARALGIKTGTLNTIVKGRVALPQADLRRRLARELGIPHVQLFVMAGEISEDELSQAGIQGVVPESPAEERVLKALRQVPNLSARDAEYIVRTIELYRDAQMGTLDRG